MLLQVNDLFNYCLDWLSKRETIPLSGICKSGARSIAKAPDAGRSAHYISGIELQPTFGGRNIELKLIDCVSR